MAIEMDKEEVEDKTGVVSVQQKPVAGLARPTPGTRTVWTSNGRSAGGPRGAEAWGQVSRAATPSAERDRGDHELGSQRLAPRAAEAGDGPNARAERPHAGGGVQRLMLVTYVVIADQWCDEGQRYADFLAHRTGALTLWSVEDEDQRQLMSHMHYVRRQGLQWER